jgi:cellulose synthase/poly-beta-1,6-N-acetylglucosamine synthase-like glycosyltransferase
MQQSVSEKISSSNTASQEGQRDQDYKKLDISMQLYFIEKILKQSPFMKAKEISQKLLKTEGIYIDVQECKQLIKKYRFVSHKSYLLSLALTIMSTVTVIWLNEYSMTGIFFAIFFSPLVFCVFNEVNIVLCFVRFNHKDLLPKAIDVSDKLPSVAVLIPSCNEPFIVAKMTFDSAMELTYATGKKEIVVVDNSDTDFDEYELWKNYVESFKNGGERSRHGIKVSFIHRDGREGFKPRNLDIALKAVSSEFIMYLDVDSTLKVDCLLRLIPQFSFDKTLAFIQLHTIPTNTLSASTLAFSQGLKSYTQRFFLGLFSHGGHVLFYGHNALWRASAVRSIGDCLEYHNEEVVVAEDLSMSLRAMQKGYQGKGAWVQAGEWVPTSMRETEAMWLRWTVGTFQVFAKHFLSTDKCKRFNTASFFTWAQHYLSLIGSGLAPICVVLALILELEVLMYLIALNLIPRFLMVVCASIKFSFDGLTPLSKMMHCYKAFFVLDSYISWICCIGLVRYLTGQKQGWEPTGKTQEGIILWRRVFQERWLMITFSISTIGYSCYLLMTTSSTIQFFLIAVCAFVGVNTLLSVLLFGRSRMSDLVEKSVKIGSVQNYESFY